MTVSTVFVEEGSLSLLKVSGMVLCVMGVATHSALKAIRLQGIKREMGRCIMIRVASQDTTDTTQCSSLLLLIPCTHCICSLLHTNTPYYNGVIRWEGMYCYYCQ